MIKYLKINIHINKIFVFNAIMINIIFTILLLIISFISIGYIAYIRYKNRFFYIKINDNDTFEFTREKYIDEDNI